MAQQTGVPWLDVTSAEYLADPVGVVRELRTEGNPRIAASDRGIEILSYELLAEIYKHKQYRPRTPDEFGMDVMGNAYEFLTEGLTLNMPTEKHRRVRRAKAKAFTGTRLKEIRPGAERYADELIDRFLDQGSCDALHDFGHHISIWVISALIGVPRSDIPIIDRATTEVALFLAHPIDPYKERIETALTEMRAYTEELLVARRAVPVEDRPDDFITALVDGQDSGGLTEKEVLWGIVDLLFAGHDTTRYQIANLLGCLVEHDKWEALYQHPDAVSHAVEESLRMNNIVSFGVVRTTEELTLEGLRLEEGCPVSANMLAAGRDPEEFECPDEFRLDREPKTPRVPFGGGVHKCLGHALARMELELSARTFTRRLTDVRFDPEVPLRHAPPTHGLSGPENMPLVFRAREGEESTASPAESAAVNHSGDADADDRAGSSRLGRDSSLRAA